MIRDKAKLSLEPEAPAHLYLGCIHKKQQVKLPGGLSAQAMVYDMESYLRSTMERFTNLASQLTGKPVKLKKVSTLFVNEDQRVSPARKPCGTGDSVTCPWCKHSFEMAEDASVVSKVVG